MKILIHAKNSVEDKNCDVELQAEFLCQELETSGHSVEWSNQTHPVRLILNKYDVVHILTGSVPLSLKNCLIVMASKALGLPVIVTNYGVDDLSFKNNQVSLIQKKYFDALSVPETDELKKLRLFSEKKFILPAFFKQNEIQNEKKTSPPHIVFHIDKNFNELPDVKWDLAENIYVNGISMVGQKSHSDIRVLWNIFAKKNPVFKNAVLILNESNLKNIIIQNLSVYFANYLKIDSIKFSKIIQMCLSTKTVLVLNESQASGFPDLWSSGNNGIIRNFEKSFLYQLSFSEILEQISTIQFKIKPVHFIESKINELSRIYAKLKSQKEIKLPYANMPRRS